MLRQASGTLNPGSLNTDGQGYECPPAAAQPHFPYGAEILAWTSVLGNKIHTMAASAAAGQPDPPCPSGLRLLSQREYSPHPASVSAFFFFLPPSCSGSFLVAGPEGLGGSSSFAVCRTHLSTKHQAGGNLEASGAHCLLVQIRTVRHKEGKDLPKATMLCHTDNRVITPICTIFLKSKKNKNK